MALRLENVSKAVGAERHVSDVSLSFEHASLNVLLGPTLAGKTTLMRLMAGIERPTQGGVLFDRGAAAHLQGIGRHLRLCDHRAA